PAPVRQRRPPARDRIEVPVHRVAERQARVPEEIEPAAAGSVRGLHDLVPHRGHPVDHPRGDLAHRAFEEPAWTERASALDIERRWSAAGRRDRARSLEPLRSLLAPSDADLVEADQTWASGFHA